MMEEAPTGAAAVGSLELVSAIGFEGKVREMNVGGIDELA